MAPAHPSLIVDVAARSHPVFLGSSPSHPAPEQPGVANAVSAAHGCPHGSRPRSSGTAPGVATADRAGQQHGEQRSRRRNGAFASGGCSPPTLDLAEELRRVLAEDLTPALPAKPPGNSTVFNATATGNDRVYPSAGDRTISEHSTTHPAAPSGRRRPGPRSGRR